MKFGTWVVIFTIFLFANVYVAGALSAKEMNMASQVIVVPVLPDKLEDWKKWIAVLNGSRKADFDDYNKRYGITGHRVWLVQTPDGGHLAVVLLEGEGAPTIMGRLATSNHSFDVEFKNQISAAHGIDFTQPPPPSPKLLLDAGH